MQKNSPEHSNEVLDKINASAVNNPALSPLRNHIDEIARELAAQDAFQQVNGRRVRSDAAWTDWLFSGADEKYLT